MYHQKAGVHRSHYLNVMEDMVINLEMYGLKEPSRTAGQSFEWDVQLFKTGKKMLRWASRDESHLNVSLDGKIIHK